MASDSSIRPKTVHWVGSSRRDLQGLPGAVTRDIGQALWFAQMGDKHPSAKPLKGFKGAGILEIVQDYFGDTYRAVYTVRFAKAVIRTACLPEEEQIRRKNTKA